MLRTSKVLLWVSPFAIHFAPGTINSLNSRYIFLITVELLRSLAKGFPTSLFMKFLAKERTSRLEALLIIGIAPSDLRSFSATFKALRVSFYDRAIPTHSPPSAPRSLSLIESDSIVRFLISMAAIHTAPWIPRLFLRMLPSTTPISKCLSYVLAIKSSRNSSKPSPLIILEARFKDLTPLLLMMFLIACMP